jgi:hypothetical protein
MRRSLEQSSSASRMIPSARRPVTPGAVSLTKTHIAFRGMEATVLARDFINWRARLEKVNVKQILIIRLLTIKKTVTCVVITLLFHLCGGIIIQSYNNILCVIIKDRRSVFLQRLFHTKAFFSQKNSIKLQKHNFI